MDQQASPINIKVKKAFNFGNGGAGGSVSRASSNDLAHLNLK
jgi:hypothetical protein